MESILILGGSGLVGRAIIDELNKNSDIKVYSTYFENPSALTQGGDFKLNIENLHDIDIILEETKPQCVISCLRGDFNKQLVLHEYVAEYLKNTNGKLYFFSTLNVFDNDLTKPHYEDEPQNSSSTYGQYKLACENKIQEILKDNACILRLPQVWGKACLRKTSLLKSLNEKEKIIVYPKLINNSTTDILIAKQLCYIMENRLKGIFHLVAEDLINHKEFYEKLILGLGFTNPKFKENLEESGVFALLSKRFDEFPKELRITNNEVIDYLIS